MLIDVEGIINSRPLTYLYDDDVMQPLTPTHLLAGRNLSIKSNESAQTSVVPIETLGKRARYLQRVLEMYWNRFKTIYLAQLREHHMYTNSRSRTSNASKLDIGDVVVVKEDKITPRSCWRSGRVESLIVGKDGKVRGAELVTNSKGGRLTKITRPLQKIIPLEVVHDEPPHDTSTIDSSAIDTSAINTDASDTLTIDAASSSISEKCNNVIQPSNDVCSNSNSNVRFAPRRDAAKTGELIRRLQKP